MSKAGKGKGKEKKGKKPREDRTAVSMGYFDPIHIEAANCRTVVLMLFSPEAKIVLQAVGSLDKFASKQIENLRLLLDNGVMEILPALLKYDHICVRRFALKLLATLATSVPSVRAGMLQQHIVDTYVKILTTDDDLFMQEFSSRLLIALTKDIRGIDLILNTDVLKTLFNKFDTSIDPDIQINCLTILSNILIDIRGYEDVDTCKDFTMKPIVKYLTSTFPEIQMLAINVLHSLISRTRGKHMQKLLRDAGTIELFLDIISDVDMADLHPSILEVLSTACDNDVTAELVISSGQTLRLVDFHNNSDPVPRLEALKVLVKLAINDQGRKALFESSFVDSLIRVIFEPPGGGPKGGDMWCAACFGIAWMVNYLPALTVVMDSKPVARLFDILKNESMPWTTRHSAAIALYSLFKWSKDACLATLECDGQVYMLQLLLQPVGQYPADVTITLTHLLRALAAHQDIRSKIMSQDLVNCLLYIMKASRDSVIPQRISACDCLCAFLPEDMVKCWLGAAEGAAVIMQGLQSGSFALKQSAAAIVQLAASDRRLNTAFIDELLLECLLQDRRMRNSCPTWEMAIESIFSNHLSAKFSYTNRLEIRDITKDDFYVTRRPWAPFPILDAILRELCTPRFPILLANFSGGLESKSSGMICGSTTDANNTLQGSKKSSQSVSNASRARRDSKISSIRIPGSIPSALSLETQLSVYQKPIDVHLPMYLVKMQDLFDRRDIQEGLEATTIYLTTVGERSKVLAEFVCRQMCGPDPIDECNNHLMDLHLNELKWELETNAIPLGFIRVGGYLERSVLFKVLADRLGIPCALVKGDNRTWVEVAIPVVENEDSPEPPRLPSRLLRPNYVVDLMQYPGELLQCGTLAARVYQGEILDVPKHFTCVL